MMEIFVLAILFLFINLLFVFKRVPILAIPVGIFTVYVIAMVFIGSTEIPAQPYFSFFVLMVTAINILINGLDIKE